MIPHLAQTTLIVSVPQVGRSVVTVSGAAPVDVTFSGNSTCCRVSVVTVTMSAGTHTVTIANSFSRAPSIDKIVVSR